MADIMLELKREREQTLVFLPSIPDDAWQKVAPHAALGEVSVEYAAKVIGLHERMHLRPSVSAARVGRVPPAAVPVFAITLLMSPARHHRHVAHRLCHPAVA